MWDQKDEQRLADGLTQMVADSEPAPVEEEIIVSPLRTDLANKRSVSKMRPEKSVTRRMSSRRP
jgi:hypothetical protein